MKFSKYHALGNVYIVIEPADSNEAICNDQIKTLCSKNYGVSSDGVLVGPYKSDKASFGLRIFNPDGGEAEKCGNGLRIFCRFLYDNKLVENDPFTIETKGGVVRGCVLESGRLVQVEMGMISFSSVKIPVEGNDREVLLEDMVVFINLCHFSTLPAMPNQWHFSVRLEYYDYTPA